MNNFLKALVCSLCFLLSGIHIASADKVVQIVPAGGIFEHIGGLGEPGRILHLKDGIYSQFYKDKREAFLSFDLVISGKNIKIRNLYFGPDCTAIPHIKKEPVPFGRKHPKYKNVTLIVIPKPIYKKDKIYRRQNRGIFDGGCADLDVFSEVFEGEACRNTKAVLDLTTTPNDATVFVDSETTGLTTNAKLSYPFCGDSVDFQVVFKKNGWINCIKNVALKPQTRLKLHCDLRKLELR